MGACEACHASKVKCRFDGGPPPGDDESEDDNVARPRRSCDRCSRLELVCVPHVSRQGKHSKRRKSQPESSQKGFYTVPVAATSSASQTLVVERQFVKLTSQIAQHGPMHFGINHIIRQWLVLAYTRKSFWLLEIASRLANRVKIPMDQILHGNNLPSDWFPSPAASRSIQQPFSMVKPTTTLPSVAVASSETPNLELPVWEIPTQVAQAMRCVNNDPAKCPKVCGFNPDGRWMLVRETRKEQVRFFVSKKFARDICDLSTIQHVWKSNKQEYKFLWLVDSKDKSYGKSFLRLISQCSKPGEYPKEPIRSNSKKIRLKGGTSIVTMDLILYYSIVNIDHSFMVNEFIPAQDFVSPFEDAGNDTERSSNEKTSVDPFDDFPAFEGFSDEDDVDWAWLEDLMTQEMGD